MLGFFQDFHQTFGEQALPPQAIQDLLKSLFIFFVTPLLLLSISCMIASRTGHSTLVQLSPGGEFTVAANRLSTEDGELDQTMGGKDQNLRVFCQSIPPTQENNP